MIVGIPTEIKTNETRVSVTPAGVHEFVERGHDVLIQQGAGLGSGISDADYQAEGARIVESAKDVFDNSEMIIKVKEPQPVEIELLKEGQLLYTYLHLAPDKAQTEGLLAKKVTGIAYETIEVKGRLPLLDPMSEIAGKVSAMMGAHYLARPFGGKGILTGGVPGVKSARYLVIGGGTAGLNAAKVAAGLGAEVTIMDINLDRMRYLEDVLPANCKTIISNKTNLAEEITKADVIIGTVLIPGAKTPKVITREMLKTIPTGTVLVDVSIDQGGCFETSRPTTHAEPIYTVNGKVHYCVANIPGIYSTSSTYALTNATLPYGLLIADLGWEKAAREHDAIAKGVNVTGGRLTNLPVAEATGFAYSPLF